MCCGVLLVRPEQRVLKLNSDQARNMIRAAEQKPREQKEVIMKHLSRLAMTNDSYLKAFQIRVKTDILQV